MAELLRMLVRLGEKAGNLARIIRAEKTLFELLVEEKTGEAKNKRFVHDFKTLGDVLIQEMIKHDVGEKVSFLLERTVCLYPHTGKLYSKYQLQKLLQ